MEKEKILSSLNFKTFYHSLIPSLKRENSKGEALGLCPFHDDHNPSLSVNLNKGLWNCLAGCGGGDIFDFYMKLKGMDFKTALREIADMAGITEKDSRVVAIFEYKDSEGKTLYIKERIEPGSDGRGKTFLFRHLVNGQWVTGRGCDPVLYNLPQLHRSKYAFVVEGEGKADLLPKWGLVATCLDSGANSPWLDEYSKVFEGKEKVVILPDNDQPGRSYAFRIAQALKGKVKSIKLVELSGLQEGEDIIDWAQVEGNDKERLLELIRQAPEHELSNCPPIYSLDSSDNKDNVEINLLSLIPKGSDLQLMECSVEWIIDKLIPKQSITLLHGKGGIGKTWLALIMANDISKGIPFLSQNTVKLPVVFIDFENSLPVLVDRVRKIGIEDVLFWHSSNEKIRPSKLDREAWNLYKNLPSGSLLIFDTLRASQDKDENDSRQMAFVMSRLKELRDLGFTILLLHHTPKGNDRTYKGSTAILDLCDHSLSLHRVKKNRPDEEIEDDDESDSYFRFGTKDKTRYEPFHTFLTFNPEKGFELAPDPDTEDLEAIHQLITGKEPLNQSQIYELVKDELQIRSKDKLVKLLRKGTDKFWKAQKDKRAIFYTAISDLSNCPPIYIPDNRTIEPELSKTIKTDTLFDSTQTLNNSALSNCPDHSGTIRTDEAISVLEVLE